MSPKNTNRAEKGSIGPWIFTILSIAFTVWFFFNRQYVLDIAHYWQYVPSSGIATIKKNTTMTDKGYFYFYMSQPELENAETFNKNCQRKEANSPILGCYTAHRIYIYNVTNQKLNGIEEVTAAHETLHAIYERLGSAEIERLTPEIRAVYKRVKTPELEERMNYYRKNEPGEEINELYAILGTEFSDVGPTLEKQYAKYFSNRESIVRYHEKTQAIFTNLSNQAKMISNKTNALVDTINSETKEYNRRSADLSAQIATFNARANQSNGFNSQAEFDTTRNNLLNQVADLNALRDKIEAEVAEYKNLRSQLEAVAAESDTLNKSIDSTLAPVTSLSK